MPWSGRNALLARWLPQFHDADFARHEANKYLRGSYAPDDTRADAWMARALVRDQDLAAIATDPENFALGPSRYELNGCYHCAGRGFVRLDVDPGHAEFGKAKPCPVCSVRTAPTAEHCAKCAAFAVSLSAPPRPNRCMHCHMTDLEPAGPGCHWPIWHDATPQQVTVETVLKRMA